MYLGQRRRQSYVTKARASRGGHCREFHSEHDLSFSKIALDAVLRVDWRGTKGKEDQSKAIAGWDQGSLQQWRWWEMVRFWTCYEDSQQDLPTDWTQRMRENPRISLTPSKLINRTDWSSVEYSKWYSERNIRKAVTCSCGSDTRTGTKLLVVWMKKKGEWNRWRDNRVLLQTRYEGGR